jgi:hypothetical protein
VISVICKVCDGKPDFRSWNFVCFHRVERSRIVNNTSIFQVFYMIVCRVYLGEPFIGYISDSTAFFSRRSYIIHFMQINKHANSQFISYYYVRNHITNTVRYNHASS